MSSVRVCVDFYSFLLKDFSRHSCDLPLPLTHKQPVIIKQNQNHHRNHHTFIHLDTYATTTTTTLLHPHLRPRQSPPSVGTGAPFTTTSDTYATSAAGDVSPRSVGVVVETSTRPVSAKSATQGSLYFYIHF